jgi:pantothenate synthetase
MRLQAMADQGERSASALASAGREVIAQEKSVRLDYLEVVDPETLDPVPDDNVSQGALVVVAAYLGSTRLIDNLLLFPAKSV